MSGLDDALAGRVRDWIARDPDADTRAELETLIDAGDGAELGRRFAGRLAFGTAGLRGRMAAGPTKMNRLVVRESCAGIARWLASDVPDANERGVLVAHDARRRSERFAADAVEVLAGHGVRVVRVDGPTPTPVAVHAMRREGCAAGIVITASHNPPADNGLKLYLGDGAQIVPPIDARVAAAIEAVAADGRLFDAGATAGRITTVGPESDDDYVASLLGRMPPGPRRIALATTAMHGVGGAMLSRVLGEAGFEEVYPVGAQEVPDPEFPTVAFPNPEEPGATDLLARRMAESGAPVGLALDPDADRVAVLVARPGTGPLQLTGDEVGCLLGEWLLGIATGGAERLLVSSVVSSALPARIAAAHGARHIETLTGFKWLARPAMEHPELRQVLAYEEALGYAIGADVRDKDGISAALAVACMADLAAAGGGDLLALRDDLHARHGAHVTENFSVKDETPGGAERRDAAVARLIADPPDPLAGHALRGSDRPADDVLRLDYGDGLRVVVRPSGTEPKLKCYCEAVEPAGADPADARARARTRLADVRGALEALVVS